ncbi:hypothetical protein C0J52_16151 [Blattella germanica]|nr:hypothetical protein C0J52_16151 [Blattella germanica]
MLQLMMCDGKQSVRGIEYKTINSHTENLLPGFKVLIVGPVECRRELYCYSSTISRLLEEKLTLIVPNAIENILARTLNLKMNPNPHPYRIQTDLQIDSQVQVQQPQISDNNYENIQLVAGQNSGQTAKTRNGPIQNPRQTTQRHHDEIQAMAIKEMDSEPSSIKQPITKNIPVQDNASSLLLDKDDDFLCQMQFEELENKTK